MKTWSGMTTVCGLLAAVTITGCDTSPTATTTIAARPTASPTPAPPSATPSASPTPRPSATPTASATATPRPTASPTPRPTASPTPAGLASQSIFVADSGDSSITVYAPAPSGSLNERPLTIIAGPSTGLAAPNGIAVDASGRIYVPNRTGAGGNGSITVYAANPVGMLDEAPLATIAGPDTGLFLPAGIALDASGRIYVTNFTGTITVYAANPSGTLDEAPLATISGSATKLDGPNGIALDAAGRIYVANENGSSVTMYAANPSGALNEAPVAQITGGATALDDPIGVAIDPGGRIYVTNTAASNSVTVYAANPAGSLDEAPLATIAGSATGLGTPTGVAFDASGKVYVSNTYGGGNTGAITVFAAGPTGTLNETPLGTITGSQTSLNTVLGVAVH